MTWTSVDQNIWRHMASQGRTELTNQVFMQVVVSCFKCKTYDMIKWNNLMQNCQMFKNHRGEEKPLMAAVVAGMICLSRTYTEDLWFSDVIQNCIRSLRYESQISDAMRVKYFRYYCHIPRNIISEELNIISYEITKFGDWNLVFPNHPEHSAM